MYCQFDLRDWRAFSPQLTTPELWRAWAENPDILPTLPEMPVVPAEIPAIQRRRLSLPARLMFAAALPLTRGIPALPLVYGSHDGEINRSFALWLDLLRDGTLSPMSFGLSVHNALPGQWSMLTADHSEHTALCAAHSTAEICVIEAAALLREGHENVLVVCAENPLDAAYGLSGGDAPFPFALAMLLGAGDRCRLQFSPAADDTVPDCAALTLIRALVRREPALQRRAPDGSWHWQFAR